MIILYHRPMNFSTETGAIKRYTKTGNLLKKSEIKIPQLFTAEFQLFAQFFQFGKSVCKTLGNYFKRFKSRKVDSRYLQFGNGIHRTAQ